jgi:hypothetical protein
MWLALRRIGAQGVASLLDPPAYVPGCTACVQIPATTVKISSIPRASAGSARIQSDCSVAATRAAYVPA